MKTIRTMILGGVIFLVPFAIVLVIFSRVFGVSMRLAEPIADRNPIGAVAGVVLAEILAVVIILVACLLAGLAATSAPGHRLPVRPSRRFNPRLKRFWIPCIPRHSATDDVRTTKWKWFDINDHAKTVQPSRFLTSRMISMNSIASFGSAKTGSPLETRLYTWYNPPSTTTLGPRAIAVYL